jgi:hypothetical protein
VTVLVAGSCLKRLVEHGQLLLRASWLVFATIAAGVSISKILPM